MITKIKDEIQHLCSQGVNGTVARVLVELQGESAKQKAYIEMCQSDIRWLMDVIIDMKNGTYRLEYIEEDRDDN